MRSCFSMASASATGRASGQIRRAKRASLKRKRLHYNRKKSSRLGRPPSPVIGLFSFLRSERRFLLRGGSFSLSNSVQRSVKHGNDRQHKPEGAQKAGRRRRHSRNGPVYGRCTGKRALAAALPGNDAEPPSNL